MTIEVIMLLREKQDAVEIFTLNKSATAFDEMISNACQAPSTYLIDDSEVFACASECIHEAFERGSSDSEKQLHRALFALYQPHVADPSSRFAARQYDPVLTAVRVKIENAWLIQLSAQMPEINIAPGESIDFLRTLWHEHRASSHPLFNFLEKNATRRQIVRFFESDSSLNIRFFDLLAFAMIGSRPDIRPELVQNFWDECGRGNPEKAHVNLFKELMVSVGLSVSADADHPEMIESGFAGHNLFMLCALNRKHYFKLVGIMSMTELLDPSQYEKLARGCRRVGLGVDNQLEYYDEHVVIDVVHGEGWLNNVVAPLLEKTPSCGVEIVAGAFYRLETCCRYYDDLLIDLKKLN
jgi:pyrroloquinoline quinone (PQQ) biosynthesis protein C